MWIKNFPIFYYIDPFFNKKSNILIFKSQNLLNKLESDFSLEKWITIFASKILVCITNCQNNVSKQKHRRAMSNELTKSMLCQECVKRRHSRWKMFVFTKSPHSDLDSKDFKEANWVILSQLIPYQLRAHNRIWVEVLLTF